MLQLELVSLSAAAADAADEDALDDYVEAHVHGRVRLDRDVAARGGGPPRPGRQGLGQNRQSWIGREDWNWPAGRVRGHRRHHHGHRRLVAASKATWSDRCVAAAWGVTKS